VARGPGPHLLTELSSGTATRSSAPDLASLPRWASALPHVPWLRALPPREESSGAATYPTTPQWAVDHRNKEGPSCPRHTAGLICVQSTVACYRGAYKTCRHTAIVRFNSATQSQLTTPEHGYSGDTTRQGWHHSADHVQYSRVRRHDDCMLLTLCKTSLATPSH
jgi:hypothetical protein